MRQRLGYERLIVSYGLISQFDHYCSCHKKIKSKRRLARSFLLSKGFTQKDFLNAAFNDASLAEAIRVCKTKWVD